MSTESASMNPTLLVTTTQQFVRKALYDLIARGNNIPGGPDMPGKLRALKANMQRGGSPVTGTQIITYKHSSKKAGLLGYGRIYGTKTSIETFQRDIRATLCGPLYHDLDFANAQPTILAQFANSRKCELPFLEHYVAHRDAVLADISLIRDEAKTEVIIVLFGGRPKLESPFLDSLYREIRAFSRSVVASNDYNDLWQVVQSEDNKYGSFMSHILQGIEKECYARIKIRNGSARMVCGCVGL